jgi:peptide-methionine (S)-S-oxide reductase
MLNLVLGLRVFINFIIMVKKIGFGGGCHWCTEAVFSSLKGVLATQQGWIASTGDNDAYSESVIVEYDSDAISLETLIAVHVYTHSSTAQHSKRSKYRSAVYYFDETDIHEIKAALFVLQAEFEMPIVTQILPFWGFKENIDEQKDYYYTDVNRPFCKTYIDPKLKVILERFGDIADTDKLKHLQGDGEANL